MFQLLIGLFFFLERNLLDYLIPILYHQHTTYHSCCVFIFIMERVILKLSIQLHVFTFLTRFRCLFIMLGLSLILIHFPAPFPTTWPYIDIYAQNDTSFLLELKGQKNYTKFFNIFSQVIMGVCVCIYIYNRSIYFY